MTQPAPAAPRNDSVSASTLNHPVTTLNFFQATRRFIEKTLTIVGIEVKKLRHDPADLLTRAIQPILWLVIFGEVISRTRAFPTGNMRYVDFMAPGILAQSVLFVAIFSSIAVIWERDMGIIHKFLASPTPRAALVLGKALSSGVRSIPQTALIYVLAVILGVPMNWNPLALLGVLVTILLGAVCFSTFSLIIACLVQTRERFMGMGQVLTMPLFFASNAIYPIAIMPPWLQVVATINPLSYMVDALRALMLANADGTHLWLDFLVLFSVTTVLVLIGSMLYPRVVQ